MTNNLLAKLDIISIEPVEEFIAGRNVRKLDDIHLQACRRLAFNKLFELENVGFNHDRFTYGKLHKSTPPSHKFKVAFYRKMYSMTDREIYRRFMHKDLISIDNADEYLEKVKEQKEHEKASKSIPFPF